VKIVWGFPLAGKKKKIFLVFFEWDGSFCGVNFPLFLGLKIVFFVFFLLGKKIFCFGEKKCGVPPLVWVIFLVNVFFFFVGYPLVEIVFFFFWVPYFFW